MFRSIYIDNNYNPFCPWWYRLWRRLHQAIASLFPPDWIYVVWVQDVKGVNHAWVAGVYLHQKDAEDLVVKYSARLPQAWVEWEQFGLNERFHWSE